MPDEDGAVAAHDGAQTHRYVIHFPAHPARTADPHYIDFNHLHEAWKKDPEKWQCAVGKHRNDFRDLCHIQQGCHAGKKILTARISGRQYMRIMTGS